MIVLSLSLKLKNHNETRADESRDRVGYEPQCLPHMASSLWIIQTRYLSTDFLVSKSLTSWKINP